MSYPTQALETLLWSSRVGDDHADKFEASQELKDRVGDTFARFEDKLHEAMPDFDIVDDCTRQCDEYEQLQHHFILTLNSHGAGFWDGDWKSGDKLTALCETFQAIEVYKGDDNLLYPC